MLEFYNSKYVTAKKPHKFDCCFKQIEIGEKYEYQSGKYDGDFFTRAWCMDCSDICSWYFPSDYNVDGEEFTYDEIYESAHEAFCVKCRHWDSDEASCKENVTDLWHCPVLLEKIRSMK